jgi:hypothetical protein
MESRRYSIAMFLAYLIFFLLLISFEVTGQPDETPGHLINRPHESCYELFADFGDTVLHMAAANGDIELVKSQLALKVNVNRTNQQGYTPLDCAVIMCHSEVVELLMEAGAVPCSDALPMPEDLIEYYCSYKPRPKGYNLRKQVTIIMALGGVCAGIWYWLRCRKPERPKRRYTI